MNLPSRGRPLIALALLLALTPLAAQAHFVLLQPPAATEQNILGDPQKAPPCGDNGRAVPTGEKTAFKPGETITIEIAEKIYHPGHYRVALALNDPSELPPEPVVTPADTPCGSVPIDPDPAFPVLADGLLVHTKPFKGNQTFEVTLPDDVTCTDCTLQVIEFMSKHALNDPGGCFYHHCATISITPDGAGPDHSGTPGSGSDDTSASMGGDDLTEAAGCSCAAAPGSAPGPEGALGLLAGVMAHRRRRP